MSKMSNNEFINFLSKNKVNYGMPVPNQPSNMNLNKPIMAYPQFPHQQQRNMNAVPQKPMVNYNAYSSNSHKSNPYYLNPMLSYNYFSGGNPQFQAQNRLNYNLPNANFLPFQGGVMNPYCIPFMNTNQNTNTAYSEFFNPPYTYNGLKADQSKANALQQQQNMSSNGYFNYYNNKSYDGHNKPDTLNINSETQQEYFVKPKCPDVITPESTEAEKWLAARKRNFPSASRAADTEKKRKEMVDKGLLSKLELKLREKIKILKQIDGKRQQKEEKREFEAMKEEMSQRYKEQKEFLSSKRKQQEDFKNQSKDKKNKNIEKKIINKCEEVEEGEILSDNEGNKEVNIELKEEEIEDTNTTNALNNNIPDKVDPFNNEQSYFNEKDKESNSKLNLINKMLQQPKNINYSFSYKKNTILNDMFKSEQNKENNIVLQALWFFEQKGLLDD